MIEQAAILAGGLGTRLRPMTYTFPKSMVKVNSRPFLEYIIKQIMEAGIEDIILMVGYKWEMIEEHFGSGDEFGVNLTYSVEDEPLGTGGALRNAEKHLDDTFFLLYGDTYFPIDLDDYWRFFEAMDLVGAISVYTNKEKLDKNNVWVEHGIVKEYNKHNEKDYLNGIEGSISIFNRKILNFAEKDKFSLEIDLYPKLIDMGRLGGYVTDVRYYDIGTPERLEVVERVLK